MDYITKYEIYLKMHRPKKRRDKEYEVKGSLVLKYVHNMSERIRRVGAYGLQTTFHFHRAVNH